MSFQFDALRVDYTSSLAHMQITRLAAVDYVVAKRPKPI